MDSRIKNLWLDALRSGNYEQATGALKKGNGYCCLGVLCDIAVSEGVCSETTDVITYGNFPKRDVVYFGIGTEKEEGALPRSVQEWADLPEADPEVRVDDGNDYDEGYYTSLAEMNDSGASFAEIANVIEASL